MKRRYYNIQMFKRQILYGENYTSNSIRFFSLHSKLKLVKYITFLVYAMDKIVFIALVFSAFQCYGISRMEAQYVTFSSKLVNKQVKFVLFYAIIVYYRKCAETSRECANCEWHGPICCH